MEQKRMFWRELKCPHPQEFVSCQVSDVRAVSGWKEQSNVWEGGPGSPRISGTHRGDRRLDKVLIPRSPHITRTYRCFQIP